MSRVRVKICCIADRREADLALKAGADVLGLVGEMPSGPGVIGLEAAAAIQSSLPAGTESSFLTSKTRASDIAEELSVCQASSVQVVRPIDPKEHLRLRALMPNLTRVQVIHVEDESALGLIADYAPSVDRFLLDSGRTKGAAAQFGGTGTVHDWSISKRFVASTDRPVFLAGGLNSKNVFKAITEVRPYGVDVCSGVRSDGRLDEAKLKAFIGEVRRAEQALAG